MRARGDRSIRWRSLARPSRASPTRPTPPTIHNPVIHLASPTNTSHFPSLLRCTSPFIYPNLTTSKKWDLILCVISPWTTTAPRRLVKRKGAWMSPNPRREGYNSQCRACWRRARWRRARWCRTRWRRPRWRRARWRSARWRRTRGPWKRGGPAGSTSGTLSWRETLCVLRDKVIFQSETHYV